RQGGSAARQGARGTAPSPGTQGGQRARGSRTGGGAHARPSGAQPAPVPAGLAPRRSGRLQYSAPSVDGGTHVETSLSPAASDDFAHVGRNDPCPCGSGRKFKRCHGDPRMRPE
ncbi:MAG: SEC-C domain-containing protein, partial [Streptosporangiaceae bacterium]|nr:SEC-C domain-containing protein [Streptosporangiaceae bacterium]